MPQGVARRPVIGGRASSIATGIDRARPIDRLRQPGGPAQAIPMRDTEHRLTVEVGPT